MPSWRDLQFKRVSPSLLLAIGLNLACTLCVVWANNGWANDETVTKLTLSELLNMAFKENLGLKIEQQEYTSDSATESATFRKLLPSFSLASGATETLNDSTLLDDETSNYVSSLVLEQAIYQPALMASWHKSELNLKKADYNLKRLTQKLVFDVKRAWYQVLQEQVLLAESETALARLKQHKQNAEAFYKTGKIWRNDLLQANVRVTRGEQELFAARNRVTLAKSQINVLLNRAIDSPFTPDGKLEWVEFKQTLEPLMQQAMGNRLDIKQSQLDIKIATTDKSLVEAKFKPTINFKLTNRVSSTDFDYGSSSNQTTASVNLNWNFYQFGQTSREVSSARAKVTARKLALQQKKTEIMLEVQQAYLAVKESQYSLSVSEQALQQSLENFRVSQIRYKEQLGSSNDVLDAQDLLTQTRTDRVKALSRYLTALAELNFALGSSARR